MIGVVLVLLVVVVLVVGRHRRPTFESLARDVRHTKFGRPRVGQRGYDAEEVDAFLDVVLAACEQRQAIDPAAVRTVAFHQSRSRGTGYAERDVDAFLSYVERRMARLAE
jgi:DivIVA domain-containing protein